MTDKFSWLDKSMKSLVKEYPVKRRAVRLELIKVDICPDCGSPLDQNMDCTNRECNFEGIKEFEKSPGYDKFLGEIKND